MAAEEMPAADTLSALRFLQRALLLENFAAERNQPVRQ
jgi:hypothetical protein